jgi:plasmid maintenance system antidote protein VapI
LPPSKRSGSDDAQSTPESWLIQQMHYDLWQARQRRKDLHVKRIEAAWEK